MIARLRSVLAVALLGLLAAACGPFVDPAQTATSGPPLAGSRAGQTLVALHDGLSTLDARLDAAGQPVRLELRADPGGEVLATALGAPAADGWTRFSFRALPDSHGRRYLAEFSAPGGLAVTPGPPDSYPDGALTIDGQPQAAQLAFRLGYAPGRLIGGLAAWLAGGLWPALAVLGLVLLPGAALLAWLRPAGRQPVDLWAAAVLASTLSLALLSPLMLAARLVRLPLGPLPAWGLLAVAALALAARLARPASRRALRARLAGLRAAIDPAWTLAALGVIGLVVAVRLLVVRSMQVPWFGDSLEHTTIVQLMLDRGGLFDSWQPYAPYRSFTLHFGFHASAAFLAWLTGAAAPRAVVLAGQMWNVVAVLALYALASRLAGDGGRGRWAGLGAVLIAGLLAATPMCYVNWGRYAQLAGLALLPGALLLLWEAVDAPRRPAGRLFLAAVALAGMFLAYYRLVFFFAAFVLVWGLAAWLPRFRLRLRPWLGVAGRLACIALGAGLLVLPHLLGLSRGYLDEAVVHTTTLGAGLTLAQVLAGYRDWQFAHQHVAYGLFAVAGLAWLWSLVRRQWTVAAVGVWALALAAMNALQIVGLPGATLITHFSVMISLYVPVSVLGGWGLGQLAGKWSRGRAAWLLALALVALGARGAAGRVRTLDRAYRLVTGPDEQALAWIAANVPSDAVFLVNGFTIYDGTSAVGSDAGWWIPLLAGRRNTMPPQYALFDEVEDEPGYGQAVIDLVKVWEKAPFSAGAWSAACRLGVTHVYAGQLQGSVGIPPPRPLLPPAGLLASPNLDVVYHQDRVWILALKAGVCPE